MAPRAYWKGFLRLSLVSCPIALFPATSEREKVSFNHINKEKTIIDGIALFVQKHP